MKDDQGKAFTVGDLMGLLQSADLPMDAEVVLRTWDSDPNATEPIEVPVDDATAVRGWREPSKLIIHVV